MKDYNMNDECAAVFIPKGYYLFEEGKPWPTQVKTKDFNAFDIFKPIILDKDGKDAYDKISSHRRPFHMLFHIQRNVFYTCGLSDFELNDWLDYHYTRAYDQQRFMEFVRQLYKKMRSHTTSPLPDYNDCGTIQKDLNKEAILREWIVSRKKADPGPQNPKSTKKTSLAGLQAPSEIQDSRSMFVHLLKPLTEKDSKGISILTQQNFECLVNALVNLVDNGIHRAMSKDVFRYNGNANVFYGHIAKALIIMKIPITEKGIGDALFKLRINFATTSANPIAASTITTSLKKAAAKIRRVIAKNEA